MRKKDRSRFYMVAGVLGLIAAIIVGFVILKNVQPQPGKAVPADTAVLQQLAGVDSSTWEAIGTGGVKNPIHFAGGSQPPLTGPDGHPQIFYVGGEFCPYCAAERWSLVVALGRFGTFSDLKLSQSSSTDVYPDTRTFSFAGSHFASQYLTFQGVETADRLQQPLEKLTAEQQSVMNKYDAPPYTQSAGSVPFTSIANQYLTNGSGYSPELIQGRSWEDISGRLSNPNDPVTQAIVGNANYLTAAICQVTGQQPASVCTAAPIPEIGRQLATHP